MEATMTRRAIVLKDIHDLIVEFFSITRKMKQKEIDLCYNHIQDRWKNSNELVQAHYSIPAKMENEINCDLILELYRIMTLIEVRYLIEKDTYNNNHFLNPILKEKKLI